MFERLRELWEQERDLDAGRELAHALIRSGDPLAGVRVLVELQGFIASWSRASDRLWFYDAFPVMLNASITARLHFMFLNPGCSLHSALDNPGEGFATGPELRWSFQLEDETEWWRLWLADVVERAAEHYRGPDADLFARAINTARLYAIGWAHLAEMEIVRDEVGRDHQEWNDLMRDRLRRGLRQQGWKAALYHAVIILMYSPDVVLHSSPGASPAEAARLARVAQAYAEIEAGEPDYALRRTRRLGALAVDQANHLQDVLTGRVDPRERINGWPP